MTKVIIEEIRKVLVSALRKKGFSKDQALIAAEDYIEGELQGKMSHGLMAFPSLIVKLDKKPGKAKILRTTKAAVYIDAKGTPGAVVGRKASDIAIKKAGKEGVGVAFIKNMTTWLRPGQIARYIAEKGYVGIVLNNGGRPMVAPPGGYEPVIGTNPIGIGIPTLSEPIVSDMATSVFAWGEVRKSEKTGGKLPKQSFFTDKGNYAVFPKHAFSAAPMGDYKGFTFGLLTEVLTGSLLGRKMGKTQMGGDYRTLSRGGVIIIIDPGKSTNLKRFKEANTNLVKSIKKSKRRYGVKEILLPGERAKMQKEKNINKGYLNIEEKLWQLLVDFADGKYS